MKIQLEYEKARERDSKLLDFLKETPDKLWGSFQTKFVRMDINTLTDMNTLIFGLTDSATNTMPVNYFIEYHNLQVDNEGNFYIPQQ